MFTMSVPRRSGPYFLLERLPDSDGKERLAVRAMTVELGVIIYDSMFGVQKIPDVSIRSQ